MLTPQRTGLLKRALFAGVTALFALGTTGCGAVYAGEHDTEFHFTVNPVSGSFWGWTQIHLGIDINSVGAANLWAVTVAVDSPPEADLSFLSTLKGEAVVGTARTTVATVDSFSRGEQTASMEIVYLGDLHPLFLDSSTIRIEWTGNTNPAFTAWPPGGINIKGDVTINVQ